jgi:hypothetical protein
MSWTPSGWRSNGPAYADLFAQREHGEVARQALEASYTAMREVGRL